jgi:hypothetical protein
VDITSICYSPFSFSYTIKLLNNQEPFPQKNTCSIAATVVHGNCFLKTNMLGKQWEKGVQPRTPTQIKGDMNVQTIQSDSSSEGMD